MEQSNWKLVGEALRDFRRTWPQLLLTDLLARTVVVVAVTPLVGLLIKLFLTRSAEGVLTDEQIALFLLRPAGFAGLIIVGAISLGVLFAEQGALMVVGMGALEQRRVTWLDALRYVARYGVELVRLAGSFIVRMLLICLPFLAGVGGIYLLFLRAHDINFYLTDQPPEFKKALALAGLLLAILAVITLRTFAGWMLALPLVLFDGVRGKNSLRESARATAGRGWRLTGLLAAWLVGSALISTLIAKVVGWAGQLLVPTFGGNLALMAAGIAAALLLAGLGVLATSVISTILFPLLLVRLYRRVAGPGRLDPEPAPPGSLGAQASLRIPGKAILGTMAAALILVLLGGYFLLQKFDTERDIAIIAHRGASSAAPENTLAAFERAIADETDWIELDVQEDANGVVIVVHDSDFMKVAQNGLKVWDATNEDLREIDIGSWFSDEFSDQRTPTLREALELAKGKANVVIELKYYGHNDQLESRVIDIVEQTGMTANVMVMSLKLSGLRTAAALRPDWTYGLLNTASVGDLTKLDLDFLALNAAAARYRTIRRAHERGMKVYVWTIDDPVRMSVMMSRGVDGIITDEPYVARRVLEVRQQLTPVGRMIVWIAGETGLLRVREKPSTKEDA